MPSSNKRRKEEPSFLITFRGTYADEDGIRAVLSQYITNGTTKITQKRGRYHCQLPRPLTPQEEEAARYAIDDNEHYEAIPRR